MIDRNPRGSRAKAPGSRFRRLLLCPSLGVALILTGSAQVRVLWQDTVPSALSGDPAPPVMASDAAGNFYVAGSSYFAAAQGQSSFLLAKYTPIGARVWLRTHREDGTGYWTVRALAPGPGGSVYVAGNVGIQTNQGRFWGVVKWNGDGTVAWATPVAADNAIDHDLTAIAVDAAGNVYLAGSATLGGNNWQWMAAKIGPTGQLQAKKVGGAAAKNSGLFSVLVDSDGGVYMTGALEAEAANLDIGADGLTTKFDSALNVLWAKTIPSFIYEDIEGPHSLSYTGKKLAFDPAGNIVVGLNEVNYSPNIDRVFPFYFAKVAKYDRAGNLLMNVADIGHKGVADMATDAAGNIFLTGSDGFFWFTRKLAPNGTLLWSNGFNQATTGNRVKALALDSSGNVAVAGSCGQNFLPERLEYCVVKYSASGAFLYGWRYFGQLLNAATGIGFDRAGNPVATGTSGPSYVTMALTTAAACTPFFSAAGQSFPVSGGTGSLDLINDAGCSWIAVASPGWITVTSGASGTGNGTVGYSVAANAGGTSRTGAITIGGQAFTVTQAGSACTYSLNPTGAPAVAGGGSGSTNVTAPAGCAWTAASNDSWIAVTGGASGSGNGAVNYSVAANATGAQRTGTITIGGQTFSVTQAGTAATVFRPRDFRGIGRSDVFLYDAVNGNSYAGLTNGDGTFVYQFAPFTPGFDTLRTADVNADGKADLVVYNSSNAAAYIGMANGNGTFNFQSLFWSPGFDRMSTGDINGDGKTDFLLHRSSDGTTYAALSNGAGGFTYRYTLVSIGFTHAVAADFTGDGKTDVFFYRASDGLAFFGVSNGDGTFSFGPVTAGPGFDTVQTGDLNNDGKADLLLYATANGATRTGLSTGAGFAFATQSYSPGFSVVRLLDLNGDGRSDIVLYNRVNALGYFGIGAGDGTFTFGSVFWGFGMDAVEPQDLNGDGKADVVLYNSTTGTAYAGIGNGAGGFAYTYSYWGIGKTLAR